MEKISFGVTLWKKLPRKFTSIGQFCSPSYESSGTITKVFAWNLLLEREITRRRLIFAKLRPDYCIE